MKTRAICRYLAFLAFFFLASPASGAAAEFDEFGRRLGFGSADLKTVVVRLISSAIGLLGILAVIMIILGGFQWLVSGGDEEKIARAKRTISATVVGLVIIILAWAIVNFVAGTVTNVTR